MTQNKRYSRTPIKVLSVIAILATTLTVSTAAAPALTAAEQPSESPRLELTVSQQQELARLSEEADEEGRAALGAVLPEGESQYVVTFEDGVDPQTETSRIANELGLGGDDVDGVYRRAFTGAAFTLTETEARRLEGNRSVKAVGEAAPVKLLQGQVGPLATNTQSNARWHLDAIDGSPSDSRFTYPTNPGEGVTVYIADTPMMTTHTEFHGRARYVNRGEKDACVYDDWPGVDHGTAVASIAAGRTLGVAKEAEIVSVPVFDCLLWANLSDIINALEDILYTHPQGEPGVVNMSFGLYCEYPEIGVACQVIDASLAALKQHGLVLVDAAGNDNLEYACYFYPAGSPYTLTVGATNNLNRKASFSNYGGCIDVFAPGDDIMAATLTGTTDTGMTAGTSFSSPLVAGAAAVMLGKNPSMTPDQVQQHIIDSSTKNAIVGLDPASPNRLLKLDAATWSRGAQQGTAPHATVSPTSCGFSDAENIPVFAKQPACWAKAEGVTEANPFSPNRLLTRQEMVTFLWRAAGKPAAPSSCGLSDERFISGWAKQPACWAYLEGITDNNPFRPKVTLTKAQLVTFMWRAGYPQDNVGYYGPAYGFIDLASIPTWAQIPAFWSFTQRVSTGNPFNHRHTPTRAEMVTMLWRAHASP